MERKRRDGMFFDEGIGLVKMQFTDLFGQSKMVEMTRGQAEKALEEGYKINRYALGGLKQDGAAGVSGGGALGRQIAGSPVLESQIAGSMAAGGRMPKLQPEETELYLRPEWDTYQILPWDSGQENVARLICSVCGPDREPFWADSRSVLKKKIAEAEKMGLFLEFDFQCEFYLFHTDDEGRPTTVTHEVAGYYDAGLIDLAESVRRDMMMSLEEAGMEVESAHHGLTPGQHCFLLPANRGVEAGDYLQTFKSAVKRIAKRHGLHAAFMPKPAGGGDGSGLHIGVTIRDEAGHTDRETAFQFRAGILKHLRDMMIFTNPTVNSYKRLAAERKTVFQPEFPAAAWERGSDKTVRFTEKAGDCGIRLLFPDPSANPYLALAAVVSAGLSGVKNSYDLADGEENPGFPETLGVVLRELEKNQFALDTFGEKLCRMYQEGKRDEWERFCSCVTDWELREYLYRC